MLLNRVFLAVQFWSMYHFVISKTVFIWKKRVVVVAALCPASLPPLSSSTPWLPGSSLALGVKDCGICWGGAVKSLADRAAPTSQIGVTSTTCSVEPRRLRWRGSKKSDRNCRCIPKILKMRERYPKGTCSLEEVCPMVRINSQARTTNKPKGNETGSRQKWEVENLAYVEEKNKTV